MISGGVIQPLWRWIMTKGLFWLDDLQWSMIEEFVPSRKRRGPRREDDRRIISGIIHVLQSGMRWKDCPKEYGPATTLYNRRRRWSQQGLWQKMFYELSQIVGTHYENAIDSTAIKAHRAARGKKGAKIKPSASVVAAARPKSTQ